MARSPDLATGPRGLRAGHGSAKLIGDLRSGKWAGSGEPRRAQWADPRRARPADGVRRPAPQASASRRGQETRAERFV